MNEHVHVPFCVTHGHLPKCMHAWSACPGLDYATWVRLAGEHPNQDLVWRTHAFHASRNYADQHDYDLGGEA